MIQEIHDHLKVEPHKLEDMAVYYFDGAGKAIRPLLALMMANAVNSHLEVKDRQIEKYQKQIAMIAEMWHTSSLVHDDVIDHAESRRGKESVNIRYGATKCVMAGDYILGISTQLLAQIGNPEVVLAMSQILYDLVNGELQQMANREDKKDRFQLYLDKTYNKTASLMANTCKSVAILANVSVKDPEVEDMAYQYGKNIGIAFQLVDDWLDFVSSADLLGKPAAADLHLGLATAPVLFASDQHPELNQLILRRFSEPGDVERAFNFVLESQGLSETQLLARQYCESAVRSLAGMKESPHKKALVSLVDKVVDRMS